MGCGGSKADVESPQRTNTSQPQHDREIKNVSIDNVNNSNNPDDPVPSKNNTKKDSGTKPVGSPANSTSESPAQKQATERGSNTSSPVASQKSSQQNSDSHPGGQQNAVASDSEKKPKLESTPAQSISPQTKISAEPTAQSSVKPSNDQSAFDLALRVVNKLIDPEEIVQRATSCKPHTLQLQRALPPSASLFSLVCKMQHLQVLDVSNNVMGPQAFRTLMFALCKNTIITTFNISNNQTHTDCAECVGELLKQNQTLTLLDVSGNYLGKDYFSRCVAPAIGTNTSLQILRCESIGSTDLTAMTQSLRENITLTELNISHNELESSMNSLTAWLKKSSCSLKTLEMKNCSVQGDGVGHLLAALKDNTSLQFVNISSNQSASTSQFMDLLVCCCHHGNLTSLVADDIKCVAKDTWKPESSLPKQDSKLRSLSLSGCNLSDDLIAALSRCLGNHSLSELTELNVMNNPELTVSALETVVKMLMSGEGDCPLEKLSYGLNSAEALPSFLTSSSPSPLPRLRYLNLRKAKISPGAIGKLASSVNQGGIETLVLDGIKLAGSDALAKLLAPDKECSLVALSLSGCQLADRDLTPLCRALADGMPLHMLKLSANRITDSSVTELVDALLSRDTHPLALVDLMNNKITSKGAEKICELFTGSKHISQIHSVNLNNNCIDSDGATALMKVINKSALTSVQLSNQQASYDEDNMEEICGELAKTLNLTITENEGQLQAECNKLPNVPRGLTVKLLGLGGQPGQLGQMLDSVAIATDFQKLKLPHLSLQHILELASALRGYDSPQCLMSSQEWRKVTDAEKDAPSWLQVAEHRATAVYMSHLPASVSTQKLEALLEMEADCSVREVFLCKDMVTRKNNGLAWVLMSDAASVGRALQLMYDGEARVFGQSFLISRLNVTVDDEANSQAETQARKDMEKRLASRKKDDVAHRSLIQQSYQESQARHAYRLAHPAYADGRIW